MTARRQAWSLIAVALAVYATLHLYFGSLAQDSAYHVFADTRMCGPIPRAGDVLTNLAILAAGIAGIVFWSRARIDADERPAYVLLVLSIGLTAVGSAYYHWAPSDARLVWDRMPLALTEMALLVLVLADRVDVAFARAWLPFALLGAASVLWWLATGDLLLYLVVRVGAGVMIACLLLLRRGRHDGGGWLVAALLLDAVMTVCERMDQSIFAATGGIASGHNLKHILAGLLLGCVIGWLVRRRRQPPASEVL